MEKGRLSKKGVVSKTWEDSPCADCIESWCCSNLPLHKFEISTKKEALQALAYLDYRDLYLGLQDNGIWTVYLNRPCTHLNKQLCGLHGKEEQPWICKRYNPHTCWYKRAFPGGAGLLLILYNRSRFTDLMNRLKFDEDGELETVPPWEELMRAAKAIELKHEGEKTGLVLPAGKQESERDKDILKYKLNFPGVRLTKDGMIAID